MVGTQYDLCDDPDNIKWGEAMEVCALVVAWMNVCALGGRANWSQLSDLDFC